MDNIERRRFASHSNEELKVELERLCAENAALKNRIVWCPHEVAKKEGSQSTDSDASPESHTKSNG